MAGIGPITSVMEAASTAVGAGALLGSFAFGIAAVLVGRSREELAARVLTDGYIGGALGLGMVFLDLVIG